jgi:prepilin signal peptidase PulO-like enzyme (type II secretory pathway)
MIGSFLNVVIYRVPLGQNIVFPRSKCPNCSFQLSWFLNIPVLSFLFLKGRCYKCKQKISFQYPLVEFLCAGAGYFFFPNDFQVESIVSSFFYFATFCVFLCHLFIDIKHRLLPDSLNIFLLLVFLAFSIWRFGWVHSTLGGMVGFLMPLSITWLFYKLRGQIGLGGGDIKLFGILGLFLGVKGIIYNIFLSCWIGAIVGGSLILFKRMKKSESLAFGPYIILAASVQMFFPSQFQKFVEYVMGRY